MKMKYVILAVLAFTIIMLAALFTLPLMAQDVAAPVAATATVDAPNPLQSTIDGLLGKFGWLTTLLLAVGAFRLLFKPIFATWHWWVAQTDSTADDALLDKVEQSSIVKGLLFVLDYVGSIKLKK